MIRSLFSIVLLFFISCAESAPEVTAAQEQEKQPFFPVYSFLKGEQNAVDSLPVGIRQILIQKDKADTSYISLEEFHNLSDPFLIPELQPEKFEHNFKEESFFDQTLQRSNFLYTPTNTSTPIRRIDISTQTQGIYDKVVSLYMEKEESGPQGTTINKLLWRPGKEFQLITIPSGDNAAGEEYHRRVIWDNMEEAP